MKKIGETTQPAPDLPKAAAAQPVSGIKQPAWVKHAGWAAGDALYDEAARLGASWRKRENRKPASNASSR